MSCLSISSGPPVLLILMSYRTQDVSDHDNHVFYECMSSASPVLIPPCCHMMVIMWSLSPLSPSPSPSPSPSRQSWVGLGRGGLELKLHEGPISSSQRITASEQFSSPNIFLLWPYKSMSKVWTIYNSCQSCRQAVTAVDSLYQLSTDCNSQS